MRASSIRARSSASAPPSRSGAEAGKPAPPVRLLHEPLHLRLGARQLGGRQPQLLHALLEEAQRVVERELVAVQPLDDLLQPLDARLEAHLGSSPARGAGSGVTVSAVAPTVPSRSCRVKLAPASKAATPSSARPSAARATA